MKCLPYFSLINYARKVTFLITHLELTGPAKSFSNPLGGDAVTESQLINLANFEPKKKR